MNIINPYRFSAAAARDFGDASRDFDGNDFWLIPDINESTSSLTVMWWVKTSATGASSVMVAHQDVNSNNRSWVTTMASSTASTQLRVVLNENGASSGNAKDYRTQDSVVVSDGTWHHCAFTWDSGTLKLFVDGVEDTSVVKTIDDTMTTINDSAGKLSTAAVLSADAGLAITAVKLADFRIYNAVLTEANIATIEGGGAFDETNLAGRWIGNDDNLDDLSAGTADATEGAGSASTYDLDGPLD